MSEPPNSRTNIFVKPPGDKISSGVFESSHGIFAFLTFTQEGQEGPDTRIYFHLGDPLAEDWCDRLIEALEHLAADISTQLILANRKEDN